MVAEITKVNILYYSGREEEDDLLKIPTGPKLGLGEGMRYADKHPEKVKFYLQLDDYWMRLVTGEDIKKSGS